MSATPAHLSPARPAVVTLLAALVLAACHGAASPVPSGVTPSGPAASARAVGSAAASAHDLAPDPCALLGPDVAARALGVPVDAAQRLDDTEGTTCLYAPASGDLGAVSVTVASTSGGQAALAAVAREAPDATSAPALGRLVLVAPGAAWLLRDNRLLSVVLLIPGGIPGSEDAVAAVVAAVQAGP